MKRANGIAVIADDGDAGHGGIVVDIDGIDEGGYIDPPLHDDVYVDFDDGDDGDDVYDDFDDDGDDGDDDGDDVYDDFDGCDVGTAAMCRGGFAYPPTMNQRRIHRRP